MVKCRVTNCGNYSEKAGISPDVRFFKFPKDIGRFDVWKKAAGCGSDVSTKTNNYMCSVHFDNSAIRMQDRLLPVPPAQQKLADTAVPTLFLPVTSVCALSDRTNRLITRTHDKLICEVLLDHSQKEEDQKKKKTCDSSTQTL